MDSVQNYDSYIDELWLKKPSLNGVVHKPYQ
jgi:hypothetical protein